MELHLAENISHLRKHHAMTQEQLAEALGVTFAAVSKWERGVTTPELGYIVEMADLFETSVDALLGYQYRNNDRAHTVARLQEHRHTFCQEALADVEKALQKYPNDFKVVHCCATLYRIYGMNRHEVPLLRKALALAERACLLIGQNQDDQISLLSIRSDMASIHFELGELDAAIQILKENNPCDINHARIGNALSLCPEGPEQAIPYLSKALLDCIVNQITIVNGYLNVFAAREDWQSSLDLLQWLFDTFAVFKRPDTPSFLDKAEAVLWANYGELSLLLGDQTAARNALTKAQALARAFDQAPNYQANAVRFSDLDRQYVGYDNLGTSALEAVEHQIVEIDDPVLTTLWEAVSHAS